MPEKSSVRKYCEEKLKSCVVLDVVPTDRSADLARHAVHVAILAVLEVGERRTAES